MQCTYAAMDAAASARNGTTAPATGGCRASGNHADSHRIPFLVDQLQRLCETSERQQAYVRRLREDCQLDAFQHSLLEMSRWLGGRSTKPDPAAAIAADSVVVNTLPHHHHGVSRVSAPPSQARATSSLSGPFHQLSMNPPTTLSGGCHDDGRHSSIDALGLRPSPSALPRSFAPPIPLPSDARRPFGWHRQSMALAAAPSIRDDAHSSIARAAPGPVSAFINHETMTRHNESTTVSTHHHHQETITTQGAGHPTAAGVAPVAPAASLTVCPADAVDALRRHDFDYFFITPQHSIAFPIAIRALSAAELSRHDAAFFSRLLPTLVHWLEAVPMHACHAFAMIHQGYVLFHNHTEVKSMVTARQRIIVCLQRALEVDLTSMPASGHDTSSSAAVLLSKLHRHHIEREHVAALVRFLQRSTPPPSSSSSGGPVYPPP